MLALPHEVVSDESFADAFVLPVASRDGGILLALPDVAVGPQAFAPSETPDADTLVGAVKRLEVPFVEEAEGGGIAASGFSHGIVVVDFSDEVLPYLREYDVNYDTASWITPFSNEKPDSLPDSMTVFRDSIAWVKSLADSSRLHFTQLKKTWMHLRRGRPQLLQWLRRRLLLRRRRSPIKSLPSNLP